MGDESEAARILGSVETVICHRVNTPEEIIMLAGTRLRMEYSSHYGPEGSSGEGSARVQHQYKIDPNKVRALAPGAAYVISRGRAMRTQGLRAPDIRGTLPEHARPDRPDSPDSEDSRHGPRTAWTGRQRRRMRNLAWRVSRSRETRRLGR